jgi:hypothetical protein
VGNGSAYTAVAANLLQPVRAQISALRGLAAALRALHLERPVGALAPPAAVALPRLRSAGRPPPAAHDGACSRSRPLSQQRA